MSLYSYQQGQTQGHAEAVAATRERREAVESATEWQRFANKLQDDLVLAESGRAGFAHLVRTLAAELQRVDPNNPLARKEIQLRILNDAVAQQADQRGYAYDPRSDSVSVKS